MKNKNIIPLAVLTFSILTSGGAIAAQAADTVNTSSVNPPAVVAPSVVIENANTKAINAEKKASKLQTLGANRINLRLASLDSLATKVKNSKLTTDEQTPILSQISTTQTALNTLKSQIASNTDVASLKTQVTSIYTDYRIYAIFLPQINAIIALDTQTNHIAKLNDKFTQSQTRIDAAKAKGTDVTTRQNALDDAKSIVSAVETSIANLTTQAQNLKPADYSTSTSKTVIKAITAGLKDNTLKFQKVVKDLKIAK